MALLVALLLAACTAPGNISLDKDDTGVEPADTDTDVDADTDTDTDADTDTGPVDLDGDGADATTDCDDRDVDVYPGADEVWNDIDDDCDGVADADGTWSGEVRLGASAVYEGRRYDFVLDCPFEGTRAAGVLDFAITCTPDPDDENAQRLLGATLVVTPKDTDVAGDRWDDAVEFTSATGWDSDGEGVVDWSGFDEADVIVQMSGVSLAASGTGTIERR